MMRKPQGPAAFKPLRGVHILSLALNLPGPAALMRCRQMGATCSKLEPPPPPTAPEGHGGDPMSIYNAKAYGAMHEGVERREANLKTEAGQKLLHLELAKADVLITSFRPSALPKLGLAWPLLHRQYPKLSQVAVVGAPGADAESPGHDLTYLAKNGLLPGLELPATLYADMAGSLQVCEAVLGVVLHQRRPGATGVYREVALSEAAAYLALPRNWGLTEPGAPVGGGHAGYRVYPCRDGRVAMAALEPHFAAALCAAVGIPWHGADTMAEEATATAIAVYLGAMTCSQLDRLAKEKDLPLHTLPG